eukprot:913162_1
MASTLRTFKSLNVLCSYIRHISIIGWIIEYNDIITTIINWCIIKNNIYSFTSNSTATPSSIVFAVETSFNSLPPYARLGIKPGDNSVGKGVISIQETWSSETNFLTLMFTSNINISHNGTIIEKNVYVLTIGTCGLSSSEVVSGCFDLSGKELNSTIMYNIYGTSGTLKTNAISMVQYYPSSQGQSGLPLFITTYMRMMNNGYYIVLIYFAIQKIKHIIIRTVKNIDYPQIIISSLESNSYLPTIVFFENSSGLMVMSCNYAPAEWNCTSLDYDHQTHAILNNSEFETASMQIAIKSSPDIYGESMIIFSEVRDESGSGGGIFNGSVIIGCKSITCEFHNGFIYLQSNEKYRYKFNTININI